MIGEIDSFLLSPDGASVFSSAIYEKAPIKYSDLKLY